MTDLEELKKLALAATPGEWKVCDENIENAVWRAGLTIYSEFGRIADVTPLCPYPSAAYIAAANPQTVLALIRELEEARRDAERYRWLRSHAKFEYDRCRLQWYLPRFYRGSAIEQLDTHLDEAIDAARQQKGSAERKPCNNCRTITTCMELGCGQSVSDRQQQQALAGNTLNPMNYLGCQCDPSKLTSQIGGHIEPCPLAVRKQKG